MLLGQVAEGFVLLEHSYQNPYFFCQFGSKKPTFAQIAKALIHQTPYFNFTIPFFNIFLLFHNSQNTIFFSFLSSSPSPSVTVPHPLLPSLEYSPPLLHPFFSFLSFLSLTLCSRLWNTLPRSSIPFSCTHFFPLSRSATSHCRHPHPWVSGFVRLD